MEVDNVFDSNTKGILLPERVLRLVGFRLSELQYGSSTDDVLLFQIKISDDKNMFLVSIDTSFKPNSQKLHGAKHRQTCIERLGAAIVRALTTFNISMSVSRIPTLHIPNFPSRLSIRSRISNQVLTEYLITGMATEINDFSPNVQLQSQR
jgi:hypothetical protein